jgi:hypothetical protein
MNSHKETSIRLTSTRSCGGIRSESCARIQSSTNPHHLLTHRPRPSHTMKRSIFPDGNTPKAS